MMPQGEPQRQGSNRSEVWKYFTETVGGAKCKICGQLRVRSDKSTKTMHDHLRTAHKDVTYQKSYPNRKPTRMIPSVRPPKSVSESKGSVVSTTAAQSRKCDIDADRHVLYLILRCMADFDMVLQAPELSTLIQAVYPSYKVKPRTHYGNAVSEREASRISTQLSNQMQQTFFSLSADWISSDYGEVVAFSSHHLTEDYNEVQDVIAADAFVPSTSELDVAERLRNHLRDLHVDVNKLVAVVHNGDFRNVSRMLNVHNFECGARIISRIMQEAITLDCAQLMVARARILVENFRRFSKTKPFFQDRLSRGETWTRVCDMLVALVSHTHTINTFSDELLRKESSTRLTLDDQETEVFSQLSIILMTFRDEAVRLSMDSASAYYPTFLKLKAFIDCYTYEAGGVVEVFVTYIQQQMANACEQIRANKFLVLCAILDPRFRNRVDYQNLPWGDIESHFLDFAVTCALKDPSTFERRDDDNANQNLNQIMEFLMQSTHTLPQATSTQDRRPFTGAIANEQPLNENERVSPIKAEDRDSIDVVSTTNAQNAQAEQPKPRITLPVDIWRSTPAAREEHDLNFRLSFSVALKCELDQFVKLEPLDRTASVKDWWNAHSNEFPRLKKFALILHAIPATAMSAYQLYGGDPTFYAAKLLKMFGSKSTSNCLLIKSSLGTQKRLPQEFELNKSEDDL